jgi:peptide chain release factor 1
MTVQWEAIAKYHEELSQKLADPNLDPKERQKMQKDFAHLDVLIGKLKQIALLEQELADAKQQIESGDTEMQELFAQEVPLIEQKLIAEHKDLNMLLAPPGELDERSVFLEIRAGAGGQEAALFVADLMRMYTNYGLKKGWKVSLDSESHTDLGGYREVVLYIKGHNAFGELKRESGVHRVQRVPATETQGRVHTSTVTIAVLPEAKEVDVSINPADLRIDVYRASGAGGQHVNTTDSAVRITHIPTGVVVSCQDERSQQKNKAKAMKSLQSRLLVAQMEKAHAQMSKMRKEQVGTGMRAEKVRTYNYPQNRVSDHQANITLKKLDRVMEGDLDEIIDALMQEEREMRKKQFLSQFS